MPWRGSVKFDYDLSSILRNAPMKSGVYAVFSRGKWIYIGEAGNVCGQLLDHLYGDNPCVAQQQPTHFAFELVPAEARPTRQHELILEFEPVCNYPEGHRSTLR